MLQAAASGIDEIIVFAGSEDLVPAVVAARQMGARVTIVSSVKTTSMMVAPELRSEADLFVDVMAIKDKVTRREREVYQAAAETGNQPPAAVVVEDRRDAIFGTSGQRATTLGARARVTLKS